MADSLFEARSWALLRVLSAAREVAAGPYYDVNLTPLRDALDEFDQAVQEASHNDDPDRAERPAITYEGLAALHKETLNRE